MSDGGKGSSPRPYSVPLEVAHANHELIFGVKPPKVPYVYVPPTPQELDDAKAEDEAFDDVLKSK